MFFILAMFLFYFKNMNALMSPTLIILSRRLTSLTQSLKAMRSRF